MQIMVGTIIKQGNKILMIQEGKKGSSCYGQWNFPSGHLEKEENILNGAKRETLEETGYHVKLKKIYPIQHIYYKEERIRFFFLAEIESKDIMYQPKDILNVEWMTIQEIKDLNNDLRDKENNLRLLSYIENDNYVGLDIISDFFK